MNDEIKEIIEYFKDDIDYLEEELKYPNFKGRYITIRDKECEYLRKLLDYITNLQQINKNLTNSLNKKVEEGIKLQLENERLKEKLSQETDLYEDTISYQLGYDRGYDHGYKAGIEDYKSRNEKAIDIAYEYGQIDGEHHKTWCIDQMLRALADNNYNKFVKEYENNGEYKWNIGIAP